MPNIPDLNQIQLGSETVWGDGATPTVKLMGIEECTLRPINEAVVHPQRLGLLAPGPNADLIRIGGEGSISGIVLYDDFPYWLDNLLGEATPTGGDPYTRAYTGPLGSVPSPRLLNLVDGQSSDVYKLEGCMVNRLTISGATGEALKFSADLIGENVVGGTLASLSDRVVYPAMAQHLALYLDAWQGTVGTTQISTNWFSFELEINANRAIYNALGQLTPVGYREAMFDGVLRMSLEFDATSQGYLDTIVGGSSVFQKLIRIKASNTANRDLQFDFAGAAITAPELYTEENGVITLDFELTGMHDLCGLENWFATQSINQVAALA